MKHINPLITLLIGALGGFAFAHLHIPLPWVLGSFFSTAICSRIGVSLTVNNAARSFALVVIGVLLGSGFSRERIADVMNWLPSILIMSLMTVFFFVFSYLALRKLCNMDKTTALFAAVPGGLTIVSAMADDYNADLKKVALCHSLRLISLLAIAPFMIRHFSDYDLADAGLKSLTWDADIGISQLLVFIAFSVACFLIAHKTRLPSALLLIPLLLSGLVHVLDIVSVTVPSPAYLVAQIIIGAGLGIRFSDYDVASIVRDGWAALLIGAAMAVISFSVTIVTAGYFQLDGAPLLLAMLPGGAPELGVVAISLNIDPAFVATHHMIRVMLIAFSLPLIIRLFASPNKR